MTLFHLTLTAYGWCRDRVIGLAVVLALYAFALLVALIRAADTFGRTYAGLTPLNQIDHHPVHQHAKSEGLTIGNHGVVNNDARSPSLS